MTPRPWERFVLLLVAAAGAAFVSAAVLDALRMRRVIRDVGEPTGPVSPTAQEDRRTRAVQARAPVSRAPVS